MKKFLMAAFFVFALTVSTHAQALKPYGLQGKVVPSIAYSPDGLLLAAAYGNTLQLWQAGNDSSSFTLSGTATPVTDLTFSKDNRHLLAANGKSATIWDIKKREVVRTFEQGSTVLAVAYSPDNSFVALGGKDSKLQVWDVQSGKLVHTFEGHTMEVTDLTFSLDGSLLISGSADRTIKVWSLNEKRLFKTLTGHQDWVKSLALSRDSTHLVSAGFDKRILLWNLPDKDATNYTAKIKNPHANWIAGLDVSTNNFLVSVGHDNRIALYDLNIKIGNEKPLFYEDRMFRLIEQQPNAVRFNPANFQLAVATLGNGIYFDNYFQLKIKSPHQFKIVTKNENKNGADFTAANDITTFYAIVGRPDEVKSISVTNVKTNEVQEYTGLNVPEFTFTVALPEKNNTFKVVIEDKDSNIQPVTYHFKVTNTTK